MDIIIILLITIMLLCTCAFLYKKQNTQHLFCFVILVGLLVVLYGHDIFTSSLILFLMLGIGLFILHLSKSKNIPKYNHANNNNNNNTRSHSSTVKRTLNLGSVSEYNSDDFI